MEEYVYPKDHSPDFLSILVPNVDNVRTDYLIHIVSNQGKVCYSFPFQFSFNFMYVYILSLARNACFMKCITGSFRLQCRLISGDHALTTSWGFQAAVLGQENHGELDQAKRATEGV